MNHDQLRYSIKEYRLRVLYCIFYCFMTTWWQSEDLARKEEVISYIHVPSLVPYIRSLNSSKFKIKKRSSENFYLNIENLCIVEVKAWSWRYVRCDVFPLFQNFRHWCQVEVYFVKTTFPFHLYVCSFTKTSFMRFTPLKLSVTS